MGGLQPWHWLVLAIVVVALFGYNKLPDITRSVGKSLRIFKTEMKGLSDDDAARETAKTVAAEPTVAPAVVVPVTAATTTEPTDAQIAQAQAVLAAAAQAQATRTAESTTPPVIAPLAVSPAALPPSVDASPRVGLEKPAENAGHSTAH